jgi:TrpR family trp operon transcriptional repressor
METNNEAAVPVRNTVPATENEYLYGLHEMCRAVASTDDPALIEDFFSCLLTPAEVKDVSNRWLLVREIEKGTTQREIARMFGMSLCKITRGSREYKKAGSAFKRMLEIANQLDV